MPRLIVNLNAGLGIGIPLNIFHESAHNAYISVMEGVNPELTKEFYNSKGPKLLSVSDLIFKKCEYIGERRIWLEGKGKWIFSSPVKELLITLMEGFTVQERVRIGGASFIIDSVVMQPDPLFKEEEIFYTISPAFVRWHGRKDEERKLSWKDERFVQRIEEILLRKWEIFYGNKRENINFEFEFLSEPKKRIRNIKNRFYEVYDFTFRIKTSPDFMKFIYACGIGESTAMGFGCIERKK